MDPLALYQLDPAAHGLKSEPFLCTAGCSPFITFYGLKHKNIRNIFTANKIPDPCHDKQCKGNLAGAKIFPLLFIPAPSHQDEECVQLLASHTSSQRGPGEAAPTQAPNTSSIPTDTLLK